MSTISFRRPLSWPLPGADSFSSADEQIAEAIASPLFHEDPCRATIRVARAKRYRARREERKIAA
jgi:hypothetical protein